MVEIERAILASIIYNDTFITEHDKNSIQLKIEWFSDEFNKLVARCLVWLKEKDKPIDENIVLYYLSKNNDVNLSQYISILATTPFTSVKTINEYIDILKSNTKRRVYEI